MVESLKKNNNKLLKAVQQIIIWVPDAHNSYQHESE